MANGKQGEQNWIPDPDRFLSEHELQQLLRVTEREKNKAVKIADSVPVRDWFLIRLASETGLRVQEMADLSCGDLQSDGNIAFVVVRKGKGGKKRIVHVRSRFNNIVHEFMSWKQTQKQPIEYDSPVFSSNNRRVQKRALQSSFKRSLQKAGITKPRGVGIHCMRHTYASLLLRASNNNLRLVQQQLGHASVRTTEVYTHVFNEDIKQAVERLPL